MGVGVGTITNPGYKYIIYPSLILQCAGVEKWRAHIFISLRWNDFFSSLPMMTHFQTIWLIEVPFSLFAEQSQ